MFSVLIERPGSTEWVQIHNGFTTRDEAETWIKSQDTHCCADTLFRVVKDISSWRVVREVVPA
jgi:hypothetical protein